MTRYVIIGAGAVGASFAAELHRAGVETLLLARGAHLAAIRENGLRYVRPDGVETVPVTVAGTPADVELTGDDVLILATKAQDTAAAVLQWAGQPVKRADGSSGTAGTDLRLLTLQNGLDSERAAQRRFRHVLGGVIWIPATYLVPGEVVSLGTPQPALVWLGRYPSGVDPRAETVADDLRRAGIGVQVVTDITRWKATKLLGNLVNALDALYAPSELRAAALVALQAEARAVFASATIELADHATESTLDQSRFRAAEVPGRPRGGSSTWQSLTRDGTPETDYLNGEVVLLARLNGADAALNAAIQNRLHRAVAEGTPPRSLDDADLAATLPGLTRPPAAPAHQAELRAGGGRSGTAEPGAPALGTAELNGAGVLIGADDLHRRLAEPEPPILLDVRWALGDPHGAEHYRRGHIPSAAYVDLETELAGPHAPGAGRHPLPDLTALQASARNWGVTRRRGVVVYDNTGGLAAARAWWLLRWAGVPDVRILDGGLAAWAAAGHGQATGDARPQPPSDIVLDGGRLPTLTADQAAALAAEGVLLDARAAERYRGEVEPVDPRAGHIPGALSAPTTENLQPGVPLFRAADELRERFAALGVDRGPVGVYCGSGVTAAHEIAALAVAGIEAALYPGSWSAWSSDENRPIETGQPAAGDAR